MMGQVPVRRLLTAGCCVMLTATGCAFDGINSLPLPGAVGRGSGADIYHVEMANVSTLESNSPLLMGDVVIGSVGKMTVRDWHADVEVSVQPGVVIPANAVATIGQTSLLGSMHMQLGPPVGVQPAGKLQPGATIALNKTSTYPSTEQTLSSLSLVVNGGGLGQLGDVIHNFNAAFSGREGDIRDLVTRLDDFVGTFDAQRDNLVVSLKELNRLAGTFAAQRDVVDRALQKIPPALEVLVAERPRITTALEKLKVFSDTATSLVNNTQADLVKNLQNLEPAIRALADVGPGLDTATGVPDGLPVRPDVDRPGRPGRLHEPVRGPRPHGSSVQEDTVPRYALGRRRSAADTSARRTPVFLLFAGSAGVRRRCATWRPHRWSAAGARCCATGRPCCCAASRSRCCAAPARRRGAASSAWRSTPPPAAPPLAEVPPTTGGG